MQATFDAAVPEIEETAQDGVIRRQVVILPCIALQQAGMIGEVVKDLRSGQAVALELKGNACHASSGESFRLSQMCPRQALFQRKIVAKQEVGSRRSTLLPASRQK